MRKNKELIGGLIFFIFAAAYFSISLSIPKFEDGFVSSDFMPKLYGVILIILSSLQIFQGISLMRKGEVKGEENEKTETWLVPEVILTFVFLILYVAILKPVGFLISTILFLVVMIALFSPKEKRNIIKIILISVIFTIAVYLIFVKGLSLTLPEGILGK